MVQLKRVAISALIGAVCAIVPCAAIAQAQPGSGFYIGGNFGFTWLDSGNAEEGLENDIRALGFASVNASIDETSTGFKLLAGYQINPNIALEGYYANLGTYDLALGTTGPALSVNGELKITAIGVDLVGTVPFGGPWSGIGRIGVFRWDAKGSISGAGSSDTFDDDGTDFKFGLGVQWRLSPNLNLRGEWELYNTDDTISMFSLGLIFRF